MIVPAAFLVLLATASAHPHSPPHSHGHARRNQVPAGEDVSATGDMMYDMGDGTFIYAASGTGIGLPLATVTGSKADNGSAIEHGDESDRDDMIESSPRPPTCDPNRVPVVTVYETVTATGQPGPTSKAAPGNSSAPFAESPAEDEPLDEPDQVSPLHSPEEKGDEDRPSEDGQSEGDGGPKSGEGQQGNEDDRNQMDDDEESESADEGRDKDETNIDQGDEGDENESTPEATVPESPRPVSNNVTNSPGAFYEAPSPPDTPDIPVSSKRGLAFNSAALTKVFADQGMSWAYNWAALPAGDLASKLEFVPMLWGEKKFDEWDEAAEKSIAQGARHMLSFNEPDLPAQANMDAATAAAAHIKHMNPYGAQVKIGSPAVTNGGPEGGSDGMGLEWMKKFLDACADECQIDFLAFHWYDAADKVEFFKKHVKDVVDLATEHGIDFVWLTEFGASGSDQEVAKFLDEVLPWLDTNSAVERYAYFMCSEGVLLNEGAVSDPVGKSYALTA